MTYRVLTEMNVLNERGLPGDDYFAINHHDNLPYLAEVRVDGFLGPMEIRAAIRELQDALAVVQPEWDRLGQDQQTKHQTQ